MVKTALFIALLNFLLLIIIAEHLSVAFAIADSIERQHIASLKLYAHLREQCKNPRSMP
jgi:hypothetical protein